MVTFENVCWLAYETSNDHTSAIADHVKTTGHNLKWDHFDILASGKTGYDCKIKEVVYVLYWTALDDVESVWQIKDLWFSTDKVNRNKGN